MKRILTTPRFALAIIAALFCFNLLLFGQTPAATGEKPSDFETAAKVVGYITSFITLILLVAGIVWYAVSGKNREQLKDNIAALKDALEIKSNRVLDLERELAEVKSRNKDLEIENDDLERKNLRLQNNLK